MIKSNCVAKKSMALYSDTESDQRDVLKLEALNRHTIQLFDFGRRCARAIFDEALLLSELCHLR